MPNAMSRATPRALPRALPSALPLLLLPLLLTVLPACAENNATDPVTIIDFRTAPGTWLRVNDGVMGGLSASSMTLAPGQPGVFAGRISLENNGGFASTRTQLPDLDLGAHTGIALKVRGDGRTYQLRLRNDDSFEGAAYRALFTTTADSWVTVRLPFTAFEPSFRGRILQDYPPLDPTRLTQLTLLLADKQAGPFQLEIDKIMAYSDPEYSDPEE
ncbi:CIA30 family protein [bacterium DOLZORAL124_64_63]|nr:MAG: CIA30 family protein [bacterium DOLZORAL124_64_63]